MDKIILFATLAIFPLGQIIRIGIIQPIDILVGIGAVYAIFKKLKKPLWFKYFENFLIIALFSWLFSLLYFRDIKIFYGVLYLIRLGAYFYFSILVSHSAKQNKNLLLNSFLSLSLVSSLFGWIQLFKFPDIKPFFVYGWDEHLYRLVGTFLDPTFLGLIIVFGIIISFFKKKWFIFWTLLVSLIFTYSRASYLALFGAFLYLSIVNKNIRKYLVLIPVFVLIVLLLPSTKNQSISFLRTFSAMARIENYKSTIEVFKKSPVFGIGYNNLCFARNKYIGIENYSSHACSGSDSSILFVLATTGIVGLFIFLQFLINLWRSSNIFFRSILIAVLVHSLFSNSLFYSWILYYLLITFFVSLGSEVKS